MPLLRHTLALLLLLPLLLPGGWAARAQAPVFTSSLVQTGYVNVYFSYKIETDQNADFTATGLPTGLSLSQERIRGTPTGPANTTNTIVLQATNSSATSTTNLTLILLPATTSPVITSSSTASGTNALPFSYRIIATNVTVTGYGAYNLPSGLSIDPTSGQIAGTPTVIGSFPITLVASNATSVPGSNTLTITILPTTIPLLDENFEHSIGPVWQVGDANGGDGIAYWATVPTHFAGIMAAEGAGMAYCAGYGYGSPAEPPTYRNKMLAYLQRRHADVPFTHQGYPSNFRSLPRADLRG
jgi:hypothetical protein